MIQREKGNSYPLSVTFSGVPVSQGYPPLSGFRQVPVEGEIASRLRPRGVAPSSFQPDRRYRRIVTVVGSLVIASTTEANANTPDPDCTVTFA